MREMRESSSIWDERKIWKDLSWTGNSLQNPDCGLNSATFTHFTMIYLFELLWVFSNIPFYLHPLFFGITYKRHIGTLFIKWMITNYHHQREPGSGDSGWRLWPLLLTNILNKEKIMLWAWPWQKKKKKEGSISGLKGSALRARCIGFKV